jgi:hypothetical protein
MAKTAFNKKTFLLQQIGRTLKGPSRKNLRTVSTKTGFKCHTIKVKEDVNGVLHLERSFVWCSNVDTSESRSEIPRKFFVMLEKDGEKSVTPIV